MKQRFKATNETDATYLERATKWANAAYRRRVTEANGMYSHVSDLALETLDEVAFRWPDLNAIGARSFVYETWATVYLWCGVDNEPTMVWEEDLLPKPHFYVSTYSLASEKKVA